MYDKMADFGSLCINDVASFLSSKLNIVKSLFSNNVIIHMEVTPKAYLNYLYNTTRNGLFIDNWVKIH